MLLDKWPEEKGRNIGRVKVVNDYDKTVAEDDSDEEDYSSEVEDDYNEYGEDSDEADDVL